MRLIWRFLAVSGVFFLAYGVISLITGMISGETQQEMASHVMTIGNAGVILGSYLVSRGWSE